MVFRRPRPGNTARVAPVNAPAAEPGLVRPAAALPPPSMIQLQAPSASRKGSGGVEPFSMRSSCGESSCTYPSPRRLPGQSTRVVPIDAPAALAVPVLPPPGARRSSMPLPVRQSMPEPPSSRRSSVGLEPFCMRSSYGEPSSAQSGVPRTLPPLPPSSSRRASLPARPPPSFGGRRQQPLSMMVDRPLAHRPPPQLGRASFHTQDSREAIANVAEEAVPGRTRGISLERCGQSDRSERVDLRENTQEGRRASAQPCPPRCSVMFGFSASAFLRRSQAERESGRE